jgi:HTH-type transcriptional regulator/antitoxin MqsA
MADTAVHTCPECGGAMVRETRPVELRYQDAKSSVRLEGWWCPKCGEGVLDGKALAKESRAFKTLKAKVDHVLPPAEVVRIRTRLGLNQRKAAELFGGGINAFHKYEKGEAAVTTSMSQLLRLLDRHPELVQELEQMTAKEARKSKAARSTTRKAS